MNKMQNNSKKNRVKSQPGRIAQVSQPRLLGFHAAATAFPTIFQFLHRILVRKFVAHFFFVLTPILNNGFEMTGAQRTTRSRVPLLSPNAKICTISSEGTLMLQTTKRIFGLHTAQSKRS